MSDELSVLREMILDTDKELWADNTLEDILEDAEGLCDVAAVVWNMVASSKEKLEFYFGSLHSEDIQKASEQSVRISERYSEMAEGEDDESKIGETQATLWDDFGVDKAIDSLT